MPQQEFSGVRRIRSPARNNATISLLDMNRFGDGSGDMFKQSRGVATRYDKLLANFAGFVKFVVIAIRLNWLNRHHALVMPGLIC